MIQQEKDPNAPHAADTGVRKWWGEHAPSWLGGNSGGVTQNGVPVSESNPLAVNVVRADAANGGGDGSGGGLFGGIGSAIERLFGGGGSGGNSGPHWRLARDRRLVDARPHVSCRGQAYERGRANARGRGGPCGEMVRRGSGRRPDVGESKWSVSNRAMAGSRPRRIAMDERKWPKPTGLLIRSCRGRRASLTVAKRGPRLYCATRIRVEKARAARPCTSEPKGITPPPEQTITLCQLLPRRCLAFSTS